MKKITISLIFLISLFVLSSCGGTSPRAVLSDELGLDVSGGQVVIEYDNYGGRGEGTSCIAIELENENVLEQIESSGSWSTFPLDETTETLVYGIDEGTNSYGPYITDDSGEALVPEITNGYYILIDRHADQGKDILSRASFNFTIGLYDTDLNILYCCRLDT